MGAQAWGLLSAHPVDPCSLKQGELINWKETANMRTQCSVGLGQRSPDKERLLAELHTWERKLVLHSLNEAIRLIESEKIEQLTGQHLHCIAEYDAITIDGECFFDKAFTSGKEVAACLAFAKEIGWQEALDDMLRLRLTLLGRSTGGGPGTASVGAPSSTRFPTPLGPPMGSGA